MDTETITFAHLSDLHILRSYDNTMFEGMIDKMETIPENNLRKIASWLKESAPALKFVLLTGDLVHEGNAEDYQYLKALLQECFGNIPVYPALGNHDRVRAFHEGYEGAENTDHPVYYAKEINGLQLIVLDSSVGCDDTHHGGQFCDEQFDFLEKALEKDMPKGHIIAFHHPAFDSNADEKIRVFGVEGSERLGELIHDKKVLGILTGHTHENINTVFKGIPAYTAESTAFGVAINQKGMYMTEKTGFNLCTVSRQSMRSETIFFPIKDTPITDPIALEDLMASMQHAE